MEYADSIKYLTSKDKFYIDLGLERIQEALEKLGNPQDSLNCIHVAGTNGKGSFCAILESILREAGYKTGLYTSPHIFDYTERIQICGKKIPKDKFAGYIEKISSLKIHLTEFEILTVIAFLYFKEMKTDVVLLETGMGGRLDATNVIKKNLCSIITQIDLDHTERLGETKEKIAYEKAGIIKKGCPVITSMGYESIKDKADEEDSLFIFVPSNVSAKFMDALSLKGKHQEENLALVLAAINYIFPGISEGTIIKGLKNVKHPFRFSYYKEYNLIIDVSHNVNGITALRENLDIYFPNSKKRFIFGCLNTKNYPQMMKILFKDGDEVYLNAFDYPNACTFEELSSKCPIKSAKYRPSLKFPPDKLNIICGSFYMLKDLLEEQFTDLLKATD